MPTCACSRRATVAILVPLLTPTVLASGPDEQPFEAVQHVALGEAITLPSGGGQPTALYDPSDPQRLFKMWWLGNVCEDTPGIPGCDQFDPAPPDLDSTDRIFFSHSANGSTWSAPEVVLWPRGGADGFNAADDHLVGSPTVLKIDGTYYMFYEAYGNWVTTIVSFYDAQMQDTWNTNGAITFSPDYLASYQPTASNYVLGYAPLLRKHGTHPIYSGEVIYANGVRNRFLSCAPVSDPGTGGVWRALNDGKPVFWLYDQPAQGRKAIYVCFRPGTSDSFITDSPSCSGALPDGYWGCGGAQPHLIGYAIAGASSPDMRHANQNRICLATSVDGVVWTRFSGPFSGGAVAVPDYAFTNVWPHDCGVVNPLEAYDLHRAYGSGYPVAIVRDDTLELYYSDDSFLPMSECVRPPYGWRATLPVARIADPGAYLAAEVQPHLQFGAHLGVPMDLKWSPMHRRYFVATGHPSPGHSCAGLPSFGWTGVDPDPAQTPSFGHFLDDCPPSTGAPYGIQNAILGTGLGHTVDFPSAPTPYTAFHLYYCSSFTDPTNPLEANIHHALIFTYNSDSDGDGVIDSVDGCPIDPAKSSPGACGCGVVDAADVDASGIVGFHDLNILLSHWQMHGDSPADIDDDGVVDFPDLNALLNAWGALCNSE